MRNWWAALAMIAMVGCGSSGGAEEAEGEETEGAETSEYEGAIASTDTEHGGEVYASFCDDCHPDGEDDVGPSLIGDPHTPARLRQQIREGSGRMRPFSQARISDDDLEALLAYMASINAIK